MGGVAQRPHVRLALNTQVTIDHNPAALSRDCECAQDRRGCISDGGDDGLGVDRRTVPGLDSFGRRRGHRGLYSDFDATPAQQVGRIRDKMLRQLRKNARTMLN